MSLLNTNQIEFWNSHFGLAWANNSDAIDFAFSNITHAIMQAASLVPGDRVMDLGCGSGGTSIAIAGQVGSSGCVLAVDISKPMINRLKIRKANHKLENLSIFNGDAAILPFKSNDYDVLVSRFGCMFFNEPQIAFRNIGTALRQDCRLALAVWRTPRENPWAMEPISVSRQFLDMPPRPGPEEPGPFSFSDPERVRNILLGAGWTNIELTSLNLQLPLGRSDKEALAFLTEMGPLAAPLAAATKESYAKAIGRIKDLLDTKRNKDGIIQLAAGCWIITGLWN
ncbi:MAG: class I SAM-dependent methyltransferase [Pseudomonadota bacterium]|nr:class I SAM-dependent methyltransferase [Pseudomonadota bacterium]